GRGPGSTKTAPSSPSRYRACHNGHELSRQAAARAGCAFPELSNGFASCQDPLALQAICDRLGPADIQAFFDRWMSRLPLPLTDAGRAASYWRGLSMRPVEGARGLGVSPPPPAPARFSAPAPPAPAL